MASYSIDALDSEARTRYKEKLDTISLTCCPYLLPADVWTNDPTKWPALEYPEVYCYLIETPGVFTKEAMNNRKSLEAHNQFRSGWVRTIYSYEVPNTKFVIMKADVTPSQRLNDRPHTPWIALNSTTTNVVNSHCTCMAGLGESCSHVGALLFKIEAAVRAGFTRKACTDEACRWNDDFKENISPAELSEINLYNATAVENFKKSAEKRTNNSFPGTKFPPKQDEIHSFLRDLSQQKNNKPIVLHTFSEYHMNYIPKYKPPERAKLPQSLREWYSPANEEKTPEEIAVLSNQHLKALKISEGSNDYIQKLTQKQSESPIWHDIRSGRITASNAHEVLHTNRDTPAQSLIKKICKKSKVSHTTIPSLKWGIEHEKRALDELYLRFMDTHSDFSIDASGIRLHCEHPYIGASPDGIFTCQCHNINRLIEIKCPYSKRDCVSVEEAASDNSFFIDTDLRIKYTHKYYTQVQIQLFVFNVRESEFVIWTPQWVHSQIIPRDDDFLKSALPVLESFFEKHIIPELLTRKLENASKDHETLVAVPKRYCICNSEFDSDENWIGCDSEECKWEWFHYSCVNVKRAPKGSWYCPWCKKAKKRKLKDKNG